jgi:hypothetical protein
MLEKLPPDHGELTSPKYRAYTEFEFAVKKVKFTLERPVKVQRGSRGIALLFL